MSELSFTGILSGSEIDDSDMDLNFDVSEEHQQSSDELSLDDIITRTPTMPTSTAELSRNDTNVSLYAGPSASSASDIRDRPQGSRKRKRIYLNVRRPSNPGSITTAPDDVVLD